MFLSCACCKPAKGSIESDEKKDNDDIKEVKQNQIKDKSTQGLTAAPSTSLSSTNSSKKDAENSSPPRKTKSNDVVLTQPEMIKTV